MFLNLSFGNDYLESIVVRSCTCLPRYFCVYLLVVCLLGQTLIVGPLPHVQAAAVAGLPAQISDPPMSFEISDGGGALSLVRETSGVIGSLLPFVTPEKTDKMSGGENAVLEPPRDSAESLVVSPPPPTAGEIKFDFDGDGKADIGRWKGLATEFKVKNSNGGAYSTYTLGTSGAAVAPGDFNGDGKTDAAVFSAGTWTYKTSPTAPPQTISFGTAGDKPFAGDYDGDGITDAAVFRSSTNTWWIRKSTNSAVISYQWGTAGDVPITGNWDGDSKTDIAVYRPSTGTWNIRKSSGGQLYLNWGLSSDIPLQGDFDGDGKSDATVFRPTTGTWYTLTSLSNWTAFSATSWGVWSDQPVPAKYDNDSKTDLAVWRPTDGKWYILKSTDNSYEIHTLGVAGDTAVPSAYTKQVGGTASGDVINAERVKPRNATGETDLYSQNFGWGTSLVGLPGRAGLDAGFGIGYNSLVWLKVGSAMYFDPDKSNVTPGFRFGFPVIEPIYYNATRQKWAYMMVTPTGSRVEFLETAASNVYETADSSYAQLTTKGAANPFDPVEDISIQVTTTDGTQMTYVWSVNSYKCTQIKDRNGNYITMQYDSLARLATMTDTLGRVVTVNYDPSNGLPSTITQTWKNNNGQGSNVTHTWATFAYTTKAVDTDFATNLSIIGPPDGTVFNVLEKITYPDGSSTKFEYNDYLQVKKVSQLAADSASHVLNYISTNLAALAAAQSDCPRFTETRSWVENFNQDTGGTPQEVIIPNSFTTNQQYTLPTGGTATGNLVQVTGPDGTVEKTFTGNTGWREGLPIATETWANINSTMTKKRWTWTDYTQEDINLTYIKNPRVIESKVGDTENNMVRRSTIEYLMQAGSTTLTQYGLVKAVNVYDADQTTVLKRSETDYNLATAYTTRRIIGLPAESRAMGRENGLLSLVSKMTYAYDEGNFSDSTLNQNISPIQHDSANYGASFILGRGLPTSTTRRDVTGQTASVTHSVKYNTAGAPVAQITPWDDTQTRTTKIDYTDNWNATGIGTNTFAYPTKLYDPAGNLSQVKYRYDIGATVWAQSPAPAGNTVGKTTERTFDSIGRLQKDLIVNSGAYTRYEYPTNGIQSKVFSTIVDTNNNNTGDAADEVLAESWSDGAGRVRRARTPHTFNTNGTTATWAGTLTEYDLLGRVKRSSVPTEVDSNFNPTGDDLTRGWLWTQQEYDWKGRVTRTIPSDSTGSDGKDTLITYEGCGCAGGEVTTVQSELVPRDDQPTVNARRTQKTYTDILGRAYKTEVLNWDGAGVYTTTVNSFNGSDQVTNTRQYAGTTSASVYQDVTMTYDGHGRMKTRHYPIEDSGAATTWNYNVDDTIMQVIDPRGVITDFTYNNRGLTTNINYTLPNGSTIPASTNVVFSYDNLGNRTQMTDGLGTQTYEYDSLSRLTSETRQFAESLAHAPLPNNGYKIEYVYNLSGGLRSYKDPFGKQVDQANDKLGHVTGVTGSAYGDNATGEYASGIQYRAFGQVKQVTLETDDDNVVSLNYDNGLRVSSHKTTSPEATAVSGYVQKADFIYSADSRPQVMDNQIDNKFDRTFKYDFAGRLTANSFGNAADGIPYTQTLAYDGFSQLTNRAITHWGQSGGFAATYVNGRKQGTAVYDAAGNMLTSGLGPGGIGQTSTFDAAGRQKSVTTVLRQRTGLVAMGTFENVITEHYDGDGHPLKSSESDRRTDINPPPPVFVNKYQVWSSVLSAAVTELTDTGAKKTTKVFAGGAVIAEQRTEINSHVEWISADPVTGSSVRLRKDGAFYDDDREEAEPLGQLVLPVQPYEEMPSAEGTEIRTADEPEWLCAAMSKNGVSFMDLPTVCKTIALNSGRADFYDLHPISSPTEIASGNAHATSTGTGRGEKPVLRTAERLSPEELARRRALAATGKFDNEGDEESGSIIDSNIPGADIGRLNGVTDLSERELSRESESGDCLGALHAVNANEEAYRRAIKHRADLERAVQNHVDVSENFRDSFGWQMLAAIGIRESGFMARDEIGGGGGRGVFQITGASVSDEILNSVENSAGWVLTNRIANVYMEPVAQGQARSVLWTLRNYNAGGASSHGRRMSLAILKSGSVNAADWDRGTAYPGLDTKKAPIDLNKGNYVTSILRIARDCFGDPKIGINF